MNRETLNLPEDIWIQIIKKLGKKELAEVSQVSKYFLSVTNLVKSSLRIHNNNLDLLERLLRRFQYVERIIFSADSISSYCGIFRQISRSRCDTESRKRLKKFDFQYYWFSSDDFIMIEKLFPWTTELTFSLLPLYKSEQLLGFQKFMKLTELKKVSFIRHCNYVSDELLVSISLNCMNLEKIEIDSNDHNVTKNGIVYLMMHSPKLSSLVIKSKLNESPVASPCSILEAMSYAKNLHTIKFYGAIDLTANSSFSEVSPLVYIIPGTGTYTQMAFHKNKNIRCFVSKRNPYLDDTTLKKILRLCPNLKKIEIASCKLITDQGIVEIFKYFPSLTQLNIAGLDVSRVFGNYLGSETVKLKSLHVARTKLNDQCLIDIGKRCIDLEYLGICGCSEVTTNGVMEAVKNYKKLKVLDMRSCYIVTNEILEDIATLNPSLRTFF